MENIDFNDAIKNVKSFISPNDEQISLQLNNKNNIRNSPNIDFSFKKNLNSEYDDEENNIKTKEKNEKKQSDIYSKNEESIFSSGNFGNKKTKEIINDENINISNFSIFKETNKSNYSSFDNYFYSSSSLDNMDYNYTKKNLINNNINNSKEISPFLLPFSNKNDNKIKKEQNIYNFNDNNKNEFNIKRNLNENLLNISNEEYKIRDLNKMNVLEKKRLNKKSYNKFIVLNNSSFQKELDILFKQFCNMSLSKENKENLDLIENKNNNKTIKNNFNYFRKNNNYISIRKAFSDITNTNYNTNYNTKEKKENKKTKTKMPKNFEIHKRKVNIIKFEELIKESNKSQKIEHKRGGCICRQYKNKE